MTKLPNHMDSHTMETDLTSRISIPSQNESPEKSDSDKTITPSGVLPVYTIHIVKRNISDDDEDDKEKEKEKEEDSDDEFWNSLCECNEPETQRENVDNAADKGVSLKSIHTPTFSRIISKHDIVREENVPLFVNAQIEQLVDSVVEVLQEVNPDKVQQMIQLARQPVALKKIINKPEIQTFIDKLCGQPVMSNWESFNSVTAKVLTIRMKGSFLEELPSDMSLLVGKENDLTVINLEIAESTVSLERLVGQIRKNVLLEAAINEKSSSYLPYRNDEDGNRPLPQGSWKNLLNRRDSILSSTQTPFNMETLSEIKIDRNDSAMLNSLKGQKSIQIDKSTRVGLHKSPGIVEVKNYFTEESGFTLASYSGFFNFKKLSSDGEIYWNKDNTIERTSRSNHGDLVVSLNNNCITEPTYKRPKDSSVKANNPCVMSKLGCTSCKEDQQIARCTKRPTHGKFIFDKDIEKHFEEFHKRFMNDEFFKRWGLEFLLKMPDSQPINRREQTTRNKLLVVDPFSSHPKPTSWDLLQRVSNGITSGDLNNQREYVEELLLHKMTADQRKLVIKQMINLKSNRSNSTEGTSKKLEIIPFSSFVIPVLTRESITKLIDGLDDRMKAIAYKPASKGGLGLSGYMNDTTIQSSANKTNTTEKPKIEPRFSILDIEKLKYEIASQETHKKYLKFLKEII